MVRINGQDTVAEGMTVQAYIDRIGYCKERIAVEMNGQIVPRKAYGETILSADDKIEIVQFVGGG